MKDKHADIFAIPDTDPVVQQVIRGFLDGFPMKLQKFATDSENGDWKAVRADLHTFKGATAMMDMKALSTLFKSLEELVLDQDYEGAQKGLQQLAALWDDRNP